MRTLEIADISDCLDQLANSNVLNEDGKSACIQAAMLLRETRNIILSSEVPENKRIDKLRRLLVEQGEG